MNLSKVAAKFAPNQKSRYKQSMDGTMQDIKKVLNEINWPKGAKRVSYQVAPYSALAGYSLATITFTY